MGRNPEEEHLIKTSKKEGDLETQISDSSHLMVLTAWSDISVLDVEVYIAQMVVACNKNADDLAGLKNALLGIIIKNSSDQHFELAATQACIALQTAIAATVVQNVDAACMEGFNTAVQDESCE